MTRHAGERSPAPRTAAYHAVRDRRSGCRMSFAFQIDHLAADCAARAGRWMTPHGVVHTPAFMPVGTRGTVKGVWPGQLREIGTEMVLANTYHLALRPGADVIADLGGLHRVMAWDGPILTDSGGFQVYSLSDLRRIDDERIVFRSHVDGSLLELTPERAVAIQEALGADCIMCLDECPPHDAPREALQQAVDRTTRWAERCRRAQRRPDQALFGIVQGGIDRGLRERSIAGLLPLDFPGYAVGGLSVGERPEQMYATLDFTIPLLPADRPRYLMGVGKPRDIIEAVLRGVDLFDCVMPTRNARNATAFTSRGTVKLRNQRHLRETSPLDETCECPTCRQFSRGYLRHLFMSGEMLGPMLVSVHNLAYYQRVMRELRVAILADQVTEYRQWHLSQTSMSGP